MHLVRPATASVRDVESLAEIGALVEIPPEKIRPFAGQPRRHFSHSKLLALQGSIVDRAQKLPVLVRPIVGDREHEFELIDGERRWRACLALKRPVLAIVRDVSDPDEQFEEAILANFNREPHTPLETAHALERLRNSKRIRALKKGEQVPAIARMFGHSDKWAWDHLGLLRLVPEIRKLLEPNVPKEKRIPFSLAAKLSGFDRTDQLSMYQEIKGRALNFTRASQFINHEVSRRGLDDHRRGRKPSDNLKVFESFARRVGEQAKRILEIPKPEFAKMVESRNAKEIKALAGQLKAAEAALRRIRFRVAAS